MTRTDGISLLLLHQERRPHLAIARESRSRNDWNEYWYVCLPTVWKMARAFADMFFFSSGNQSAGESPFGGIKESGYGKESGKDVAVAEYVITKTGTLTVDEHF